MKIIIILTILLSSQFSSSQEKQNNWDSADPYEYFMGRWSSLMSVKFLSWIDSASFDVWLDLGCGTGALSETIITHRSPGHLICLDPSKEYLSKAEQRIGKGQFLLGDASAIPLANDTVDILVSGLVLNFIPDIDKALEEMKRVVKSNGVIAAYVWDYSGKMEMLRYFWDAAILEDPNAKEHDEGIKFPICNADNLKMIFKNAGISEIEVEMLDIETHFRDFEDYWNPFLGEQGPAPSYFSSLSIDAQEKLKNRIYHSLPINIDGSICLIGRAIAIKGTIK